jgi:8-amino-7-oxononanoate synthase
LHPVESPQGAELSIEGRRFVQFCTNNYLGLANDPEVIEAAREATARFGTGAGASRLVAGSMELHHELERQLARFKQTEAALLFPTGYMANLAVLTTFAGERDLIVSDKLNHASLIDAARFSGAAHRTFVHRSAERAGTLLGRECEGVKFLVTDSIFSMDGDVADLRALADAADEANALLVIDEAHATGVLGARGAGLAELQGVEERIAITVGTLSKALGSMGGFVAGPRDVIDTLINEGRSFIYTTALPPACSAAALASLKIVEREPERRERVMRLARHVKSELTAMGFDTGDSASPIIPVILGESATALAASEQLKQHGLYVPAIRPPTVPPNSARLRISLMATHTDGHIEQLLTAMRALR